ncbi:MAG TPA: pilus assembly protein TadG-related protein, partial [Terriglobia bacterium]|nr:pilus assembly protein TadG-related protein [Terriglobia bacterium]
MSPVIRVGSVSAKDEGQVSILVVLAVGFFLLLFVGFGVDMTNLFFHRQTAQNAADAACVAAGMDMLVNQTNGGSSLGGFTRGTAFDCSGNATSAPCKYAALNGYSSPSATPLPANTETNGVHVSFPGSVPGATVDTTIAGANPFVQVDVYDEIRVYFASLLSGTSTQTVHALAKCGLQTAQAPIPIIVLDPICTHAFEVSGSATLQVVGGPSKSVQVNSNDASNPASQCAAATGVGTCSGNGAVDLRYGGNSFTGSAFGTFGGQQPAPPNFMPGTTGSWQQASPIADPWANLIAPSTSGLVQNPPTKDVAVPPYSTTPGHIKYEDGCPDLTNGCTEYSPGWYTNAICVGSSCKAGPGTADKLTAIFDPGIYYITGSVKGNCGTTGKGCIGKPTGQCKYGLYVDSNGVIRP